MIIKINENKKLATTNDLVEWFLLKEPMSQKKIQKLAYYAQAWSLVFLDKDIVEGIQFQAWVHGPVNYEIRVLLAEFGWNSIELKEGTFNSEEIISKFSESQNEVLEQVWKTYGKFSADQLEALTHREFPWQEQRKDLGTFESSKNIISNETIKNYYKKLIVE